MNILQRDSHLYLKLGLLIASYDPELGAKLLKCETLAEVGKDINAVLRTSICRGMPMCDVLQQVADAIAKSEEEQDSQGDVDDFVKKIMNEVWKPSKKPATKQQQEDAFDNAKGAIDEHSEG